MSTLTTYDAKEINISSLIELLKGIMETHGDLPVWVDGNEFPDVSLYEIRVEDKPNEGKVIIFQ